VATAEDGHPPSISETAFDCPHCGVFTTQFWYKLHATQIEGEKRRPSIVKPDAEKAIRQDTSLNAAQIQHFVDFAKRANTGLIYIEKTDSAFYPSNYLLNLNLSKCYDCGKLSVWRHTSLIYPPTTLGPRPNRDLPDHIQADFEEARAIVGLSPRGAAALLRLSVQKLCAFLGESGANLDKDIASLVSKGLNPTIQKSLDIVRVIGNEAVHPGVIDLKDDPDTALKLLGIVNLIADQMISHPKRIEEMYGDLPEEKRLAIEARNKRATQK
jgi:hypothetical protein